ncbi:MAG: peptidoglycan DD-metalloendopeptidase family protein [Xanthomonadales bacterium]|nr:peptidoglycan DD-metalloendopeptidase family protein [Xanthomonadales bacterium]
MSDRLRPRRPGRALRLALPLLLAAVAAAPALPADPASKAATPANSRDAQRRLGEIRRELEAVAADRRRLEGQRGEASRSLRAADERVAASSRALHDTERRLTQASTDLETLAARRQVLIGQQDEHRRRLAALLRAAYARDDAAPLKLMLAQDRIADAQRQLAYDRYLQRQRLAQTTALAAELVELDRVERAIVDRRAALDAARSERRTQLAALARERVAQAQTLAGLETRYRDRQQREAALGSDAQALQDVIARLRAAAAKAEAERVAAARAAAAKARADAARAAVGRGDAGRADSRRGAAAKPPRQVANAAPIRVGGLGWPLSGTLLAGYGGRMPDGRASSGLLIAAAAGTPVRAVADGTVVFSEWMTGYGLILIVDHGNGTLSLYAHNESLLKNAGDTVKRGDAVARVGDSGGLAQTALYFELRRNGKPVDPGTWLRRQ